MEFCEMKREIDRKCLNHARVHANAQSFDRCEACSAYTEKDVRVTIRHIVKNWTIHNEIREFSFA